MELVYSWPSPDVPGELVPNGGSESGRDTVRVPFDPASESVVEVVVEAVAFIHDADPTDLDPLFEVLDPDALDALVDDEAGESSVDTVTFVYEGLEVTVDPDGTVWLRWA